MKYVMLYEAIRHLSEYTIMGGTVHCVDPSKICDIEFYGNLATVRLVDGTTFEVTRNSAINLISKATHMPRERAAAELETCEHGGRRYERERTQGKVER